MKLISFDIGIKNMAYCILDISNQNISINGWSVLNLMEEELPTELCNQIIAGKTKKVLPKPCTKLAKYTKNGQCYCEKHVKGSPFLIPNKKNSMPTLKKMKVDELIKHGHTLFLFLDVENLPKTKKDILEKLEGFYQKNCVEPIIKKKTKNASETDLITIGKNMKELLNKIECIDNVTHVVIENQISPIANRMKTIQGMLAQYFIMKNSDTHIEFVSSSHKLSQFGEPKTKKTKKEQEKPLENVLINENYKQHKKDGVYYCSRILEINSTFSSWIESLQIKKKDDLADSFLQGIWFLKHKNIITYADDLKINIV
jgi:hypothetical protein